MRAARYLILPPERRGDIGRSNVRGRQDDARSPPARRGDVVRAASLRARARALGGGAARDGGVRLERGEPTGRPHLPDVSHARGASALAPPIARLAAAAAVFPAAHATQPPAEPAASTSAAAAEPSAEPAAAQPLPAAASIPSSGVSHVPAIPE